MAEETTKKDNIDVNDPFSNKGMFAIDKGLGAVMGANQPKTVDTTDIDKAISGIEKPASGSVYDKLAARYRSQGAGAVLRTQKNLSNLFLPTINLIQEREADALARYTLLKQGLEDFDDSTIFGQADGSEMPIVDEIKSLANMTKEDMRELSRLNPADERYDVLAKKIQKNNEAIAKFDDINQKLLEIRNSQDGSDDASQWSKGMTQTERDMWMDIYTGKGNNIKIQDGKLVWTNTKTTTSYDFGGDYGYLSAKSQALSGSGLERIHERTTKKDGSQRTQKEMMDSGFQGDYHEIQRDLKALYPNHDFGTTGDNGDGIDGMWGDKTQAAYEMYLRDKDKLETEWLDKNLTDERIKELNIENDYNIQRKTTGGGETRVIDLNNISGGPTMIENAATITERKIQGGVQDLINSGVDINDPNYQRTVKSMIYQLNQTGPAGIKSLIFDGLNTDDDDIFTSENTNSFIEGVIANNAEELGIKDPKNITEQELESAIEKLKEGDVTIQYENEKGQKESLQKQYLRWYKSQIDAKVEAGVKSKYSSTTGELTDGGSGGGSGGGGGTDTEIPDPEEIVIDPRSGRSEALTTNERDKMWKNFYDLSEGDAAEQLEKIFPEFVFKHRKPMFDRLEIFDGDGNRIGTYDFDFSDVSDAKAEAQKFLDDLDRMGYNTFDNKKGENTETQENTETTTKKQASTDTDTTTRNQTTSTQTTDTSTSASTFRDTMSSSDQSRVNKFKIVGTSGAGKANIFKNNKPIKAKVKVQGGFMNVNITGVRAEGDNLIVGTSVGDQDLGRFEKRGNKYVFVPGNAYKYLEGEDKKDFDAFRTAIETDNAFAEEVRASVTGTSIFNTSSY
tara:strand:+ start:12188 stop:14731 length:2544 start_codon:yes stop_codon:yes gene_type:complete